MAWWDIVEVSGAREGERNSEPAALARMQLDNVDDDETIGCRPPPSMWTEMGVLQAVSPERSGCPLRWRVRPAGALGTLRWQATLFDFEVSGAKGGTSCW